MRRVVGWIAPAACVFILTACPITVDPPDNMPVWYSTISGYVSAPGTPGASGASAADSAALQVERPPSRPTPRGADYYAAQPRLSEDIVPGKLVVRLADPVFAASARALPVLSVGQRTPQMVAPAIGEGSFEVRYANMDVAETYRTADELAGRQGVVSAEVVPLVRAFAFPADPPNDPSYGLQWPLRQIGAWEAWRSLGAAVPPAVIAVLDSGVRDHPDLNILPGWNFIDENSDTREFFAPGGIYHGLHVAGIAGARTNNAYGIAGTHPNARIVPVKVLPDAGGLGDLLDVARAIRWAAGLRVEGVFRDPPLNANPAKVINASLGGGSYGCPTYLQSAVNAAFDRGAIVVAAAGNETEDVINTTPANCANVVTVGAVGPAGTIASYSNYGSLIDVMAPGGEDTGDAGDKVYSASWNGDTGSPVFVAAMGTSMATPHVAGVLAMLRGMQPGFTPVEAISRILQTARPLSAAACRGWAGDCGAGLLDAAAAIAQGPGSGAQPGIVHIYALSCLSLDCSAISTRSSKHMSFPAGKTSGNYSFTDLYDGIYYVFAYKDVNDNGEWDPGIDPWGSSDILHARGSVFDGVDIYIAELTSADAGDGAAGMPPFDPAVLTFE